VYISKPAIMDVNELNNVISMNAGEEHWHFVDGASLSVTGVIIASAWRFGTNAPWRWRADVGGSGS
jgi:hypothetical protein